MVSERWQYYCYAIETNLQIISISRSRYSLLEVSTQNRQSHKVLQGCLRFLLYGGTIDPTAPPTVSPIKSTAVFGFCATCRTCATGLTNP